MPYRIQAGERPVVESITATVLLPPYTGLQEPRPVDPEATEIRTRAESHVRVEATDVELPGTRCVCVGASNIVGKPVAVLLMRAQATVISTNVHTIDQAAITRTADVLISAAGVPGRAENLKE